VVVAVLQDMEVQVAQVVEEQVLLKMVPLVAQELQVAQTLVVEQVVLKEAEAVALAMIIMAQQAALV
jgi:hypothetical protein